MAIRTNIFFGILFICVQYCFAQPPAVTYKRVKKIQLQTIDNISFSLSSLNKKSIVFVFLSPECPLCQNYSLPLNKLSEKYGADIGLVGIFPGKGYSFEAYKKFKKKYNISFLLLADKSNAMSKILSATTTPEAFVLSKEKGIIYQGAIDNWAVSLGTQRNKATENYLEDAVKSCPKSALPSTRLTRPVGCRINNR